MDGKYHLVFALETNSIFVRFIGKEYNLFDDIYQNKKHSVHGWYFVLVGHTLRDL